MPNIEVKLRRGTTAQHNTFTGAEGEVTVDTDKDTIVVHDGTTAGGYELRRKDDTISNSEIDSGAITSDKISTTDTNFNVTATGKVGIGKVNSGSYQLEVDGDILINDTGDNFPAAVFAGGAGAAIQLNDQSTDGQIFNLSSNPEGVGGPGTFSIGSIDVNDSSTPTLTITNVTTTTDEATYTFSSAHNIKQGERVQTFGSSDADWNTTSLVLSVGSTTQLTVTKPHTTTNYPTTAKRVGSYVTFSVRKDYEANVMYTFLKAANLPKATTEPSWLESGQVWIDTTDMSLKIKDYA